MRKSKEVSEIINYLYEHRTQSAIEMSLVHENDPMYEYLEGSFQTADHLIAKLEKEYK